MNCQFVGKYFKDKRYQIKSTLGQGSFGRVFVALDHLENREKAFKIVDDLKYIEGFNLVKDVNSEFIMKCFDVFTEGQYHFIVTELCSHGDLRALIKKHDPISEKKVYEWILHALCGLNDLHSNQIIHRNIKPENIFLTEDDRVKIGDIGCARLVTSNDDKTPKFSGTPSYMSPEMLHHYSYDQKTDIWSLGCVLYELLFSKYAFSNPFKSQDVGSLDLHDSKFSDLMKQMLEVHADKRPSAAQLIEYLEGNRSFFYGN